MPLFHLDWFKCSDGYRLEDWPEHWVLTASGESGRPGVHIVANSEHWLQTTPLDTPGLYRQLADCDPSAEGALEFVNRHGFFFNPKYKAERLDDAIAMILATRKFVEDIENQDWGSLESSQFVVQFLHATDSGHGPYAARSDAMAIHDATKRGGLVSGVLFETHPYSEQLKLSHLNRPIMTIRPANLAVALQVQALEVASLGINLRKCKNPECPEYLGSTSHRAQAEYCSPKCQRRHSYLKRKAAKK